MEINLDYESVCAFKPILCQSKRISVSTECVVSDICQDISRIASVQKEIYLKSKDINGFTANITGEVHFTLLYITENEDSVQWMNISRDFSASFDLPEDVSAAQVDISVINTDCNMLNPRKVSLNAQLSARLNAYVNSSENVDYKDVEAEGLHILKKTCEKSICAGVCEKTFIISEQRVLEGITPERIISHSVAFTVNDKQIIGSKAIIKGTAGVELFLDCGGNCPEIRKLEIPFSQIIETGTEDVYDFSTAFVPNAVYAELVETINNERAVDIEMHVLTQMCAYRMQTVAYVQDAYSNLNEISLDRKTETYMLQSKPHTEYFRSKGTLENISDMKKCVYSHGEITSINSRDSSGKTTICVDIIYLTRSERYASVRRYIEAESRYDDAAESAEWEIDGFELTENGENVEYQLTLCMHLSDEKTAELEYIEKISLSDETKDVSMLPSLFLVRGEARSMWELAKKYNSTVERIEALNSPADIQNGKMLMIAKSI